MNIQKTSELSRTQSVPTPPRKPLCAKQFEGDAAHICEAIAAVRAAAERLEDACPASQADTRMEETAHELIHALHDAANIAERALGAHT